MSQIIEGKVWLGSCVHARNATWLKDNGIQQVISIRSPSSSPSDVDMDAFVSISISHVSYRLMCDMEISSLFPEIAKRIEQGGRTFIHCTNGISRSATIVIAYLMSHHQFTMEQAIQHVRNQRTIFPSDVCLLQLCEYEKSLFDTNSMLPNDEGIRKCRDILQAQK